METEPKREKSKKSKVIEHLFASRLMSDGSFNEEKSLVTQNDVSTAIRFINQDLPEHYQLSPNNTANFWKDFTRNLESAASCWPALVAKAGYTGVTNKQSKGVFRFVRFDPAIGLFPSPYTITEELRKNSIVVQSLSLSTNLRNLSNGDEDRVIELSRTLHVIETYFASNRVGTKLPIKGIEFLQPGVKLQPGGIDALWSAEVSSDGSNQKWFICCEVKTGRDDILDSQLLDCIRSMQAHRIYGKTVTGIIPIAIKSCKNSDLLIIEYREVPNTCKELTELTVASQSVISIRPPVSGI